MIKTVLAKGDNIKEAYDRIQRFHLINKQFMENSSDKDLLKSRLNDENVYIAKAENHKLTLSKKHQELLDWDMVSIHLAYDLLWKDEYSSYEDVYANESLFKNAAALYFEHLLKWCDEDKVHKKITQVIRKEKFKVGLRLVDIQLGMSLLGFIQKVFGILFILFFIPMLVLIGLLAYYGVILVMMKLLNLLPTNIIIFMNTYTYVSYPIIYLISFMFLITFLMVAWKRWKNKLINFTMFFLKDTEFFFSKSINQQAIYYAIAFAILALLVTIYFSMIEVPKINLM